MEAVKAILLQTEATKAETRGGGAVEGAVVTQEESECILCGHYPRIFFTRAHTTRTVRTWSTMSGRSSTPQGQAISIRSARKPEKVDQADGVAGGWEQLEMRPTTGTGKWPRE